jgi:hypothetical protein
MGAVGAAQMAKASGIKFAAKGADFITSGPQMMMVGENPGGKERVTVEPLSSPNIEGPKSSGGNISFGDMHFNFDSAEGMFDMVRNNPDKFRQLFKEAKDRGVLEGI